MNKSVITKEDILKASRELIQRQGWSAVNIRSVAAACGVSVGRKTKAFFEIHWRVSSGSIAAWNMAAKNIQAFLPCILWDLWGRISRMESGGCSVPGSTFWIVCVLF